MSNPVRYHVLFLFLSMLKFSHDIPPWRSLLISNQYINMLMNILRTWILTNPSVGEMWLGWQLTMCGIFFVFCISFVICLFFKEKQRQIQIQTHMTCIYNLHRWYTFNSSKQTFCNSTLKFQTPRTISNGNHFLHI